MIICDTHCDTLYMRALQPDHTPCVTMEAMKKGGMSLQTCTLFAGSQGVSGHPYEKAMAEYQYEGKAIPVTLSIGGTIVAEHSLEEAFKQADRALYMVKNSGRNDTRILSE